MIARIEILTPDLYEKYTDHLLRNTGSLFFYTVAYKKLLENLLGCESFYITAIRENEIIGSFPLMIKKSSEQGNIANSLPFFGSNGSLTIDPDLEQHEKVDAKKLIMNEVYSVLREYKCRAATFISNPFDDVADWYDKNLDFDLKDYRTGQITELPICSDKLEDDLLSLFEDPRPRNIRKALKSNITCRRANWESDMNFLYETHVDNMKRIEGKPKPRNFFNLIQEIFKDNEYSIYIAEYENEPIAGLLLFRFNNTIEYITPATKHEYRNLQPSSLLVYSAMTDASKEGYKYWNWGGTWESQTGVYSFKKKWGAKDKRYYYYIKIFDKDFQNLDKDTLNKEFPYFYSFPY